MVEQSSSVETKDRLRVVASGTLVSLTWTVAS